MRATETFFDIERHHIHLELTVFNNGVEYSVDAILDTGAPITEFSDQFLMFTGFIDSVKEDVKIKHGLQSQKYNQIVLPELRICGHTLNDFNVCVFEEVFHVINKYIDYSHSDQNSFLTSSLPTRL